jgi:hypothetical protein
LGINSESILKIRTGHIGLPPFQASNKFFDPLLGERIKSLLEKCAIVQDLLLEFVALFAH